MEKERRLQAAMPMLQTVEAWEEARMEGAKEVMEIKPRWEGGGGGSGAGHVVRW
jgi:hypothetical protein